MGQSPPGRTCNSSGHGVPLLNGPTEFGSYHPTPVQWTTDPRRMAITGDILFCVRGSTTGRMNWADQDYAIGRGLAAIRHKAGSEFQPFLRAVIEIGLSNLLVAATGSTFPNVSREQILSVRVLVPSIEDQRTIAKIIGALDDKIELNRQMNRTLEAMAHAIFKSWFVDFDPVVAKAAGRHPFGMDERTAALLPNRFAESELGPIPDGWKVGSVAELARYINGENFTKSASGTGRMVIRIAELNSGPGGSTVYNDVPAPPEHVAYPEDLLFSWSGSLDVYRWHWDEALINQHIFKVLPKEYPQWFVYFHLREVMPEFRAIASDKATTMGHIKREHLSRAFLVLPPHSVVSAADSLIGPLYSTIHEHERENLTLAALRDRLLPKLLSGEIRVKQIEKAVGGAV
jgi:type I restriction enzyme S subunit